MRSLLRPMLVGCTLFTCACGDSTPGGTISLVTGADGNPLAMDPKPATVDVTAIDLQGNTTTIAHGAATDASFDLGDRSQSDVVSLRVTASDAAGNVLVWGQSLPVELGGLQGATLPIFIQRTKSFAQMPAPLSDGREAPLLAIAGDRYVFVSGGNDAALAAKTQIYDLLTWTAFASPPVLPRAPKSLAIASLSALAIDDAGASWIDLTSGAQVTAVAASGGTYAEVAGGATIVAPDGTSYVVGATRMTGDPTARVLAIDASGNQSFFGLSTPRKGAAAAWIAGRGLVIAGGSATGAGVEVLASGVTTAIAFPPDATTGAALVGLASGHAGLVGGALPNGDAAPVRELDLGCSAGCNATTWTTALPKAMTVAQAVTADGVTLLAIGDDTTGATHAARIRATAVEEVPLRVARNRARGIVSPTGTFMIAGGSGTMESYAF